MTRSTSVLIGSCLTFMLCLAGGAFTAPCQAASPPVNPYFSTRTLAVAEGKMLCEAVINGPPAPPPGHELARAVVSLPKANNVMGVGTLTVPALRWFFGCSATSGAMIAGYFDQNGYPNMYTGPANGGVMPMDNSFWPTWMDGVGETYYQCPVTASRNGLDGRDTNGSIDNYWVEYDSSAEDPYVTNGWTQHPWGSAVGDYMKTSQSAFDNNDGSTTFFFYTSATPLTCAQLEAFPDFAEKDGTYGRKLFYEARGYTVTDCYCQQTDNKISGGFSFAQYVAEIDAGRPVMLNVEGHTIVGVGYDDATSTVYLHDTWDNASHTMTWGGSYSGMPLWGVSIVNLEPPEPEPRPSKDRSWMYLLLWGE